MITELLIYLTMMQGSPRIIQSDTLPMGIYTHFEMADSCYWEVLEYGDSTLLVQTICAPICSSCARIYNKEWQIVREITPSPLPFTNTLTTPIFPYAHIDNGTLIWEDNTYLILDDTEKH